MYRSSGLDSSSGCALDETCLVGARLASMSIDADRPINRKDEDRFHRHPVAAQIARLALSFHKVRTSFWASPARGVVVRRLFSRWWRRNSRAVPKLRHPLKG
jgi:hypothetical protein